MQLFSEFCQNLAEGRDSPLFHATSMKAAEKILATRMLKQISPRATISPWHDGNRAISFTRDRSFAKDWAPIIFQFDQSKLINHFSLKPYRNQLAYSRGGGDMGHYYNEREERVYMRKDQIGIPLYPYCTGVYITAEAQQYMEKEHDYAWMRPSKVEFRAYIAVFSNPLYKGVFPAI